MKAGKPIPTVKIVATTKLTAYAVKRALLTLVADKRIVHTGVTASSRWALAKPATAPAKAAFETVWDGTKDAKGDAPSLIGDRPRKAI